MGKTYQIRLWRSDDSCEEFWFDKELSDYFYNFEDAEAELKKYEGKTREELEANNAWIYINDGLPEDGERVLIKKKDRGCWPWEIAVWNKHYECWDDSEGDDYMCDKEDVECWMRVKEPIQPPKRK